MLNCVLISTSFWLEITGQGGAVAMAPLERFEAVSSGDEGGAVIHLGDGTFFVDMRPSEVVESVTECLERTPPRKGFRVDLELNTK